MDVELVPCDSKLFIPVHGCYRRLRKTRLVLFSFFFFFHRNKNLSVARAKLIISALLVYISVNRDAGRITISFSTCTMQLVHSQAEEELVLASLLAFGLIISKLVLGTDFGLCC